MKQCLNFVIPIKAIAFFAMVLVMAVLLLLPSTSHANTLVKVGSQPSVTVSMRHHGYQMGDFIHQSVDIRLPEGQTLEAQSLPLEGYVNPWLDLKQVSFEQHAQHAKLSLVWQIFATVEITQLLKIPAIVLKTTGKRAQTVTVPAQEFYYAAGLPPAVNDLQRRAHLPPLLFDTQAPMMWSIAFAVFGFSALFLYCWLTDRLPWWPFAPGPIGVVARQLKNKSSIETPDMMQVYHALNACAGQNLYPKQLHRLFEQAPYLKAHEPSIRAFVAQAYQHIYGHRPLAHQGDVNPKPQSAATASQHFGSSAWVMEAAIAERLAKSVAQNKLSSLKLTRAK